MSISEFSAAIRSSAYASWFKKSQKSILTQTTSSLRASEQVASKTSFTINDNTIKELSFLLSGKEADKDTLAKIKLDLINSVKEINSKTNKKGISNKQAIQIDDFTIYYPHVSFDNIDTILSKGFASIKRRLIDVKGVSREAKISDFFDKGHVFGIATNLLAQTRTNLNSSNATEEVKALLLDILDDIHTRLKQEDLYTSNLKDEKFYLYAKYSKNPKKYLVELQLKHDNQSSGRDTAPITNAIRRYFNPSNNSSLASINKIFRDRPEDSFFQDIITSKGSPSFIDLIGQEITETIKNGKASNKTYKIEPKLIISKKLKVDTSKVKIAISKDIQEVKKAISSVKRMRTPKGQFTSVASIEAILKAKINAQVARNMGSGLSNDVLNYRTGRFSESVQIDRVIPQRDGKLAIFYSYMKYPYQTFEIGFKQGSPASRDPRNLISKSIRDIASGLVSAQLRTIRT